MTGNESQPIHLRLVDSRQDKVQAPERAAEVESLEQLSAPAEISRPLDAARKAWTGTSASGADVEVGERVLENFVLSGVRSDAVAVAAASAKANDVVLPLSAWTSSMFDGLRHSAISHIEHAADSAGVKIGRATEQMRRAA